MARQPVSKSPVADRYIRSVCFTSGERHDCMNRLLGLTWRPGDNTGTFLGKRFRPVGAAMFVVIRYETTHEGENVFRRMPVVGFKAVGAQDGSITFDDVCMYNGRKHPEENARGRTICPKRNPSLLDTIVFVHAATGKALEREFALPVVPHLPRVKLGFAPTKPPVFEETPLLRRLIAERLSIPVGRLSTKDPVLLQRQMVDLFHELMIQPDAPENDTGLLLVDADLCTNGRGALRIYEDFNELVGVQTWNPAREVLAPTRRNPAAQVLKLHNLSAEDVGNDEVFNMIPMDQADRMVADMRRHLGGGHELFDEAAVMEALRAPASPLVADVGSPAEAIDRIGAANVTSAMRALLGPVYAEGVTNEDLLAAAHNPRGPLFCSGVCRPQVLKLQNLPLEQALFFGPEVLGRRITADLFRPWQRPQRPTAVSPNEVPHVAETEVRAA